MTYMFSRRTFIIGSSAVVALALIAVVLVATFLRPRIRDPFDRYITGLSEATRTEVVELKDGDAFDLRATMVRKQIGSAMVKMLAYNGSVPGPTLKFQQGAEVTINVTNQTDLPTTVHWHGIRVENRFDGAPHDTQQPIPVGGSFTYRLRFPDAGIYWYHPHLREDYAQEQGLYGNIIVTPEDASYWGKANREETVVLDDILLEDGKIAAFSRSGPTYSAMGRFGNLMLVNGVTSYHLDVRQSEVVRFYLTNTANTRIFNIRLPGARMKLVGSDSGRYERETFVDEVLLSPSERAVVDVLFDRPGQFAFEHHTPERTYVLGEVTVGTDQAQPSLAGTFATLRTSDELVAERTRLAGDFERPADKTLALIGEMAGVGQQEDAHQDDDHAGPVVEWEDTMNAMNRRSSPKNMLWKLIDRESGAENHLIDWRFRVGERVKLRIVNEPNSDHPMQHPFHIHGQRFLVLSRDGVETTNLVWKDTVLVGMGETVDILVEMSNPGLWMAHCHIAEHIESGMMMSFQVGDGAGTTRSDRGKHTGEHSSAAR
jgi:FtsP/CotA-like multicopper oxidase with cupredoxin domain